MKTKNFLMILQLLAALYSHHIMAVEEGQWYFDVYLDDKPIGYHQFSLYDNILHSSAEFNVEVLFINIYQYKHNNREIWNEGCLLQIKSETFDNGEHYSIDGTVKNDHFQVLTRDENFELNGCVRSFAYWNPELLYAPKLLNTQTGDYQEVNFVYAGVSDYTMNDKKIQATRYVLNVEEREIELWYGPNNEWLALNSVTKGNRNLRYVRKLTGDLTTQNKPQDERSML